jgi:cytochrome c-type biogenesis protein CcmH
MSLTILGWVFIGWVFIISSIAVLLLFLLRSRGSRREQLDLETCKAGLEDIGTRLKLGKLNEAEADAARLALLSRLRSSSWRFGQGLQSTPQTWVVAAVVFLLVSGIGAVISYVENPPDATRSGETISLSGPDGETLARLTDYARSIGTEQPSSMTAAGKLLSDVDTMIERLAARLETTPQDIEGWRMLGWSYFHTARYEQAATAFGRALELDPSSAELKLSYEEAKATASESDNLEIASSLQTEAVDKSGDGLSVEKVTKSEAMPPRERDAAIRSMVDGLAHRLESSPRDVEGWIRLMRSRVVLGEREVAETAFRKALEVFMDDSAASGTITAAAIELGLKAE